MSSCGAISTPQPASTRKQLAKIVGTDRFLETYVSAPLEWCKGRDKLYERASKGEVKNVPGLDTPYEAPSAPALGLPTDKISIEDAVDRILALLRKKKMFPAK